MPLTTIDEELINEIRSSHPRLTSLSLRDNHLVEIGEFLKSLRFLSKVDLSNNKLTSLVGLELPNLKELRVRGNQLRSLKGLEKCKKLKTIDCRDNLLGLESLREVSKLEIKEILLEGNPMRPDPSSVLITIPSLTEIDGIQLSQKSFNSISGTDNLLDVTSNSVNDVLAELGISLCDSVRSSAAKKTAIRDHNKQLHSQVEAILNSETSPFVDVEFNKTTRENRPLEFEELLNISTEGRGPDVSEDAFSDEHLKRRSAIQQFLQFGRPEGSDGKKVSSPLSSAPTKSRNSQSVLTKNTTSNGISTQSSRSATQHDVDMDVDAVSHSPIASRNSSSEKHELEKKQTSVKESHHSTSPSHDLNKYNSLSDAQPTEGAFSSFPSLAAFLGDDKVTDVSEEVMEECPQNVLQHNQIEVLSPPLQGSTPGFGICGKGSEIYISNRSDLNGVDSISAMPAVVCLADISVDSHPNGVRNELLNNTTEVTNSVVSNGGIEKDVFGTRSTAGNSNQTDKHEDSNLSDILKDLQPEESASDQHQQSDIRTAILNASNPPINDVIKHAAELQLQLESLLHFKEKSETLQLQNSDQLTQLSSLQSTLDNERLAHSDELQRLKEAHQEEIKQKKNSKDEQHVDWLKLIRECREDLEEATQQNEQLRKEREVQKNVQICEVAELKRQLEVLTASETTALQQVEEFTSVDRRNEMFHSELLVAEEVVQHLREQVTCCNDHISQLENEKSDLLGALSEATRIGSPEAALAISNVLLEIS